MPGLDEIFNNKTKFIEEVTAKLDQSFSDLSKELYKQLITKFVDQLETDKGEITNSSSNLRLIALIDKIYSQFMQNSGATLASQITQGANQIGNFNVDYYSEFSTNDAKYKATAKDVRQIINDRLGLGDKTSLKPGGYLDSLLKDTKVRNDIKNMAYREVTKGTGFKQFKTGLQNFIVTDEDHLGAFQQYYRNYAYDVFVNVDRGESFLYADSLGLQDFYYQGTIIKTSRPFCKARAGKLFSITEAEQWVNDPWIKGALEKGYISSYNPVNDMGLWACRHLPRFVSKEVAQGLRVAAEKEANPAPKDGPQPGGKGIKNQFTKIQPKIATPVNKALSLIDQIHGDGDLKNIPFQLAPRAKYFASFDRDASGNPIRIELAAGAKEFSEFALIHEMGHFLDWHSVGKTKAFNSETKDGPFKKIVDLATNSEAVASIKKALSTGRVTDGEKEFFISPMIKSHLKYLLTPREIWARAYSQFIAVRSGDPGLINAYKNMFSYTDRLGIKSQWDDDDFKEIETAIEAFMLDQGWMVNPK